MRAVTEERLAEVEVKFRDAAACCVILASRGYPGSYEKGYPIELPAEPEGQIFVAGAARKDGRLVTSGGRVLGCTAVAETLPAAIEGAYALARRVKFENAFCRSDIGQRALRAKAEV